MFPSESPSDILSEIQAERLYAEVQTVDVERGGNVQQAVGPEGLGFSRGGPDRFFAVVRVGLQERGRGQPMGDMVKQLEVEGVLEGVGRNAVSSTLLDREPTRVRNPEFRASPKNWYDSDRFHEHVDYWGETEYLDARRWTAEFRFEVGEVRDEHGLLTATLRDGTRLRVRHASAA